MKPSSDSELLLRLQAGSADALSALVDRYRSRLKKMLVHRIDGRLRNRLDASDVIQEMYLRNSNRLGASRPNDIQPEKSGIRTLNPYLWLRQTTLWTLVDMQRRHINVQSRDVRREQDFCEVSSLSHYDLATILVDSDTSPLDRIAREEQIRIVESAMGELDPIDREILELRHVDQLDRAEVAELLNITVTAAAKRYVRALTRIRSHLQKRHQS